MPDLTTLSLWPAALLIAGSAVVIILAGTRLAGVADRLADRTGMGEILAGAIFVGGSTSLPGAIASMTTAAGGYPQLAIGNAFVVSAQAIDRVAHGEHLEGVARGGQIVAQFDLQIMSAALGRLALAGVIDEHVPHDLRHQRECAIPLPYPIKRIWGAGADTARMEARSSRA